MSRKRTCVWLVKCCCCCCSNNNIQSPGLIASSRESIQSAQREEGFSELSVSADSKGDGEIQKQEVVVREELQTPLPQRGEKVTEQDKLPFLREKPLAHTGSLLRNNGARLSWKMVPSDNRTRASSYSPPPATDPQPVVDKGVMKLAAPEIADNKEVVLREVEDERLPVADDEEVGVFSSIVAISSTADHQTFHNEDKNMDETS